MVLHGCILHGLTGSCKICSIFMPRLGMNLARLCAKSCQNVMVSHGKSWQDLANVFLRVIKTSNSDPLDEFSRQAVSNLQQFGSRASSLSDNSLLESGSSKKKLSAGIETISLISCV